MPVSVSMGIRPVENTSSTVYIQHPPKNSGIAAVLSFFYIGLGQIYNGQIGKCLLMMFIPVPLACVIIFSYFIAGAATLGNDEEVSRPSIKVNGVEHYLDELPVEEWDRLPADMRLTVER